MSLFACGSIHQGHERFSYKSWGKQKKLFMFMRSTLWATFVHSPMEVRRYRCKDNGCHSHSLNSCRLFPYSLCSVNVIIKLMFVKLPSRSAFWRYQKNLRNIQGQWAKANLGPVHSYSGIFQTANFCFRIQKLPRPQVSSFKSNLLVHTIRNVSGFTLVPRTSLRILATDYAL